MAYAPGGVDSSLVQSDDQNSAEFLVAPKEVDNPLLAAKKAYRALDSISGKLQRIDKAIRGDMDKPYTPPRAAEEYKLLAERSVTNMLLPALNAPSQALYVDDYRINGETDTSEVFKFWKRNRMDARQVQLHREALTFGEAFAAVEKSKDAAKGPRVLLLSRLRTVALWVDPANDDRPAFVLNILREANDDAKSPGLARGWDASNVYQFEFTGDGDDVKFTLAAKGKSKHGFANTPVISYSPYRDLLGRTRGIIEPLLPPQMRLNQTIFELMVGQTYTSWQVRYITGMVPPTKKARADYTLAMALADGRIEADDPDFADTPLDTVLSRQMVDVLDQDGNPIPEPIQFSPNRTFIIEDEKASVGAIQPADLSGFLDHIAQALSDLATVAQIPPSAMTGSIANIAADALAVLNGNFTRMLGEFKTTFGESHEQLLGLLGEATGNTKADDEGSECRWRDTGSNSLAAVVDAWGKAASMLNVPKQALWERLPGVTSGDIQAWKDTADDSLINYQGGSGANLQRSLSQTGSTALRDGLALATQ